MKLESKDSEKKSEEVKRAVGGSLGYKSRNVTLLVAIIFYWHWVGVGFNFDEIILKNGLGMCFSFVILFFTVTLSCVWRQRRSARAVWHVLWNL